jgi:hypothetical protein
MGDSIVERSDFDLAEELLAELRPHRPSWQHSAGVLHIREWMFRGQADATWRLLPSGLRTNAHIFLDEFHDAATRKALSSTFATRNSGWQVHWMEESALIADFLAAADQSGLRVPAFGEAHRILRQITHYYWGKPFFDWPPDELVPIVALAQHYGVPTRLLDWTWKPLVAAYFAAKEVATDHVKSERFSIWALRNTFIEHSFRPVEPAALPRVSFVMAPQSDNPNLSAQGGVFTVDRSPADPQPLDEVVIATALETEARSRPLWPVMRRFTLRASEAGRLLYMLALEGVDASTVFPGYGGVVECLRERRLHRR